MRAFAAGVAIALAVLVQGVVLARIPFPGAAPNLPLLLVVAIALAAGSTAGLACGFGAGVVVDLLSDHPVGLLAACLALVGFAVGAVEADPRRGVLGSLAVVAVAAAGAQLLYGGLLALVGSRGVVALRDLPSTVLYDLLLAPFTLPAVAAVERRWHDGRLPARGGIA